MSTSRNVWLDVVKQITTITRSKTSDKTNLDNSLMKDLLRISDIDSSEIFQVLKSNAYGLTPEEIENHIKQYGRNVIAQEKVKPWFAMLLSNFKNPFIGVLLVLGVVSYLTNDIKGTIVVTVMVIVSAIMRFFQEYRSSKEAETLKAMVKTTATVTRRYSLKEAAFQSKKTEISFEDVVPGDVIHLSAGDMVPADVRLITSKDLFISESALTGESMPVEKMAQSKGLQGNNALERANLCFLGTNVVSGSAVGVVISTGEKTFFGNLAKGVVGHRSLTSFDIGVSKVSWLLIKFMVVMVPIVFIVNGLMKGDWQEAFLFAVAVAVGLTPEMLPMIVTANLAKGAVKMSQRKVVVKRLNSIQNLGAMNVLCTDKTGTLTQDKIVLEEHLNIEGHEDERVLKYAYLNSYHQTGLKNLLDRAILDHFEIHHESQAAHYEKVDEIPFDFVRRRMSVIVKKRDGTHSLICKGAVEEILNVCNRVETEKTTVPLTEDLKKRVLDLVQEKNENGCRVVAVAYRIDPPENAVYSVSSETQLILMGIIAFLDPPKETSAEAIRLLKNYGVEVKILTGDNDIITRRVCKEVNLGIKGLVLGKELEGKSESEIAIIAEKVNVFAKLTPAQKSQIIKALQSNGHTVGFLGDGINDAPALRQADVGISVDSATDIARESADIILLEKSLLVLEEGVLKGREVYGNIIKYIKMTASSNFGNVFSVLVASAFLPFLPMLSVHLLIQNLLYDFSQTALPWDTMDKEFIQKPRKWEPSGIARFMFFIGPISSVFDILTFLLMWNVFKVNTPAQQSLFQSAWFIEGLLSQTLIVHMIRTQKIPFIQSSASMPVIFTTVVIMMIGIAFPFTPVGHSVGLTSLPWVYFPWLAAILLCYCVSTQFIKSWYIKKFNTWL
ncbi:MAG: magnesium-translocating P-type ATPase [Bdellovibrio sp.]